MRIKENFVFVLYFIKEYIYPCGNLSLPACMFSAGGAAVLQPDHHAAADAGVFPAAPAERRRGEREAATHTSDTLKKIKSNSLERHEGEKGRLAITTCNTANGQAVAAPHRPLLKVL